MEFLAVLLLVSNSFLLPYLGLAVLGQEAHELVHLHEPSLAGVHVSVTHEDLPAVAASVLGAESWLRTHVLAHYPSKHITAIVVGHGVTCDHGQELISLRLSRAVENLHHSLVRWGLVKEIKITSTSTLCERDRGVLKRRLYGRNHLPPAFTSPPTPASVYPPPPPPGVPLSFAPNSPPEVVPYVPPVHALNPPVSVPASAPSAVPGLMPPTPPTAMPATPPEAVGAIAPAAMPKPCLAPPAVAMSPRPWPGEGGSDAGSWCVAKPTVAIDRLQEALDYACRQDGVNCQEIALGGSCFYPDTVAAHASYSFNSYWQKVKHVGGSCNFGGTAVLINSDPSYLQCRFMLS